MDPQITMLLTPLTGLRLIPDKDPEAGSVIAFRKGGDEALFASWDEERGMEWIPVGEFCMDPPEGYDEGQPPAEEQPTGEEPVTEVPTRKSPFGGGVRRRKELES